MTRLRSQSGFTVVELLAAMLVLGIVAMGAMTMIDVVLSQSSGVVQRTDSAQRGRLALDAMTRQIRSQVCLNESTKGLIAASPTALTFYADLGDGTALPTMRTLSYDPATRRIRERVYVPSAAGAYPPLGAPTTDKLLLDNVVPAKDEKGKDVPFFAYRAYPKPLPVAPEPTVVLAGTPGPALSPAQVGTVAVVRINYAVRPAGSSRDDLLTPLRDDVQLRNADPNATTPDPTCK